MVASLGEESGYVPYTSFSAKKSYMDAHPEILQSFTNALQKGMDYVNEHSPSEIAETIAPQFEETDRETLTKIVERYYGQETWKEDLIFTQESFSLLQNILMDSGVVTETVPYDKLVDTGYAEKAAGK